ncbi:LmbE family N-acetylglucosaminyl deacetylase [Aeromicrobium panaciterrae]|uniref:LmbE family N-acetylglucosaminyl deacetylase n=1 Tax=Aeromicrobium panaciterrae TaxID=363861 RepID=A0ABU1UQ30_9ACTN|nr:PIG-L deacetylase family protein [Aeromicrobium panaciterrae]MDR7087282.1 LmbE family N-acetylglucosaminyl deacetylase [Aeromicrobium panaciterrae]
MDPLPLEPVDESWETALVVVAHPDDVEFGAAAAVARWTDQGKAVVYCMVTSGEAGIDGMTPDQAREVRIGEQIESGKIVGVEVVEFLGLPDGIVEYGVPLRRVIAEVIRKHKPEIVITNNFRETWGGSMPNQADHIAVGKASLNAVSDAGNRWIFSEQLIDGVEPWGGVKQVWAAGSPDSKHGVDTTETFDRGVASLMAHKAYIDGLGWEHFDPAEFLEGMSRPTGSRLGVTHAAPFEVFSMSWGE